MHGFIKTLMVSGLVILTGPLCLQVQAQGYVDVEAERAAQGSSGGDPYDPYKVKPAQPYPTTSYGVSTGTAGSTTMAAPGPGGQDQNLGNLVYQLQQLQQEVMMLNGKMEEQAYEIRRLKQQSEDRYLDLDRRLGGGGAAAASAGAAAAAPGTRASAASTPPPTPRASRPQAAEQPGEGDAYRAAYGLVRGQQWNAAIGAFNKFLQEYPEGRYAPNAYYWLGELYLVTEPVQLESARQSFMLLLSQYPDNNKAPDAMYKLGKVYFQKGNRAKGREYLDRVISEYGKTNNSAVQLARDFIAENY